MTFSSSDPWVLSLETNPQARLCLYCFPYAGGGVSVYQPWAAELKPDVELFAIQLPGRENRILDPPFIRIGPLVETLSKVLASQPQKPFAFFGHSMGALVAFELARQLRREGRAEPMALFVSSHRAPHLPSRRPPIHNLPDPLFLEQLRRLKGTPEEVLAHAELRQLLLPVMRADFAICETYTYLPEPPLAASIYAMGGQQDPEVEISELAAWYNHTRTQFALQMLPGDHFYIHSARHQLLQALRRAMYGLLQMVLFFV